MSKHKVHLLSTSPVKAMPVLRPTRDKQSTPEMTLEDHVLLRLILNPNEDDLNIVLGRDIKAAQKFLLEQIQMVLSEHISTPIAWHDFSLSNLNHGELMDLPMVSTGGIINFQGMLKDQIKKPILEQLNQHRLALEISAQEVSKTIEPIRAQSAETLTLDEIKQATKYGKGFVKTVQAFNDYLVSIDYQLRLTGTTPLVEDIHETFISTFEQESSKVIAELSALIEAKQQQIYAYIENGFDQSDDLLQVLELQAASKKAESDVKIILHLTALLETILEFSSDNDSEALSLALEHQAIAKRCQYALKMFLCAKNIDALLIEIDAIKTEVEGETALIPDVLDKAIALFKDVKKIAELAELEEEPLFDGGLLPLIKPWIASQYQYAKAFIDTLGALSEVKKKTPGTSDTVQSMVLSEPFSSATSTIPEASHPVADDQDDQRSDAMSTADESLSVDDELNGVYRPYKETSLFTFSEAVSGLLMQQQRDRLFKVPSASYEGAIISSKDYQTELNRRTLMALYQQYLEADRARRQAQTTADTYEQPNTEEQGHIPAEATVPMNTDVPDEQDDSAREEQSLGSTDASFAAEGSHADALEQDHESAIDAHQPEDYSEGASLASTASDAVAGLSAEEVENDLSDALDAKEDDSEDAATLAENMSVHSTDIEQHPSDTREEDTEADPRQALHLKMHAIALQVKKVEQASEQIKQLKDHRPQADTQEGDPRQRLMEAEKAFESCKKESTLAMQELSAIHASDPQFLQTLQAKGSVSVTDRLRRAYHEAEGSLKAIRLQCKATHRMQSAGYNYVDYFVDVVVKRGETPQQVLKTDGSGQANLQLQAGSSCSKIETFKGVILEDGDVIRSTGFFKNENQADVVGILEQTKDNIVKDLTTDQLSEEQWSLMAVKQAKMLLMNYNPSDGPIEIHGSNKKQADRVYAALLLLTEKQPVQIMSFVLGHEEPQERFFIPKSYTHRAFIQSKLAKDVIRSTGLEKATLYVKASLEDFKASKALNLQLDQTERLDDKDHLMRLTP